MVRSTIFASALFALVAVVTAIPRPASLVDVDGGDHIGTGDINADNALQNVVNANDLNVEDVAYDINALGDDDNDSDYDNNSGRGSGSGSRPCNGNSGSSRPSNGNSGSSRPSSPNRVACGGNTHDHGLLDHVLKRSEESATVAIKKASNKGKMARAMKANAGKKAAVMKKMRE